MERGDLFIATPPPGDPRRQRIYLVVSRAEFVTSKYSTVVCVPVYSGRSGLPTEVLLGPQHGLKVDSALRCDELTSVRRETLRTYVGHLSGAKMSEVGRAMVVALGIEQEDLQ